MASVTKSSFVLSPDFTALFLLYSNFSLLSITTKLMLAPALHAFTPSATTNVPLFLFLEITSPTVLETSGVK